MPSSTPPMRNSSVGRVLMVRFVGLAGQKSTESATRFALNRAVVRQGRQSSPRAGIFTPSVLSTLWGQFGAVETRVNLNSWRVAIARVCLWHSKMGLEQSRSLQSAQAFTATRSTQRRRLPSIPSRHSPNRMMGL